jgi:hypothetical protein
MATTAKIAIASDVGEASLSLSRTSTLTKAGGKTDVDSTSGLARKKLTATTLANLITTTGYTADVANKVYISNAGTSDSEYFIISVGGDLSTPVVEEIGRLYGGDWMFFPWGVDDNITIQPSVATEMIVDYMVIHG